MPQGSNLTPDSLLKQPPASYSDWQTFFYKVVVPVFTNPSGILWISSVTYTVT